MSTTESAAPDVVGPYRIHGVLGRGGMGVVYLAEHRESRRQVALKTVGALTPDTLASIRLEIGTLTSLRHPGIVEIVDEGITATGPWYAMELLEGETLEDCHRELWPRHPSEESTPRASGRENRTDAGSRLASGSSASRPLRSKVAGGLLAELLAIYRRLCVPLAFLHGKGIVHRDIKPGNVFLRDGDRPVLMDFGLMTRARGGVGREELEGTRGIRGTLSYLAPEICAGETPDSRADLYALGCMLWESLTGRPPFEAATNAELLAMHIRADPGKPSDVVVDVPAALDQLVTRLLAKRPEDRLGHAEDLAEALTELEGELAGEREGGSGGEMSAGGFRRAGYLFQPKLVGRDAVLAELLAFGARIRKRSGALALVAGESGIGKTFLVSEVAQRVSLLGIRVITGECASVTAQDSSWTEHASLPLQPFRQLLQAMGDRCRQLGGPEVTRLFGSNLRLFIPYEPGLAELEGTDQAPEPVSLPTDGARERLLTALRSALVAFVAECPSLLVLDDLQWADELSLAFLESLSQELVEALPLVIIGTYRTDEANDNLRRLSERRWVHRIDLGRLNTGEVAAMVTHMLAAGPAPDGLVRFVQEHAEGIPFFVAEYLRTASAQGILIRRHGQWLVAASAGGAGAATAFSIPLPLNIAGLVRLRLSRLSPAAAKAAEVASLLGRELDAWALAATLELDADGLAPLLVDLVERQVLEGAAPGRYRFLHDKIREEAYRGIAPERRRALHARAAQALEERSEGTAQPPPYAELGYHLLEAGEVARAIPYLAQAGDLALAMSAHGDAANHYRTVLSLATRLPEAPPPLRIATWERRLGDSLLGLGQMTESIAALTRAADALGLPLPKARGALALRLLLEVAKQLSHRLLPGLFAGRRAHRSVEELLEAGRIFDRLMRAFYYKGQYVELMFTNLRTLNLSELAGPSPELAMAYASAAATAIMIPVRKLARTYFTLAFATLKKAPDPVVESHVKMLVGLQHFFLGERRDAIRQTEEAMALARRAGFSRRYDEVASVRVGADLTSGRHEPVRELVAAMEASAVQRGDVHMRSWALMLRAQCCILRGSLDEAGELLRTVETLLPALEPPETIVALAHLSYVLYRQGDLAGAESCAARAFAATSHGPPVYGPCSTAYARLAEVRVALARHAPASERPAALRAAERACKLLLRATKTFPMLDPMAALHEATRLWLLGKRRRAERMWRRGLERATALADGYAGARLALALGGTLDAAATQRRALEEFAHKSLTTLAIGEIALPELSSSLLAAMGAGLGAPAARAAVDQIAE